MRFIIAFLFFLCGAVFAHANNTTVLKDASPPKSGKIPTRIHISYTVTTGIGHGELNEVVDITQESDAHTFNIISDAQATGIYKVIKPGHIVRNSRGLVTEKGLQPSYYSDRRAEKEPSLALFDWENKVLTLKHKGRETQEPLAEATQDRLSLSYHFVFVPGIETQAEAQLGKTFKIHVADGRSLQLMEFRVGKERLSTPLGVMDTYVLTKLFDRANPIRRKIWLAPQYHMIPVRIQSVEKDGLEVEKMITEISIGYDDQSGSCCNH